MSYQWMALSVYWITSGFELPPKIEKITANHNAHIFENNVIDESFDKLLSGYGDNIKQYYLVYSNDTLSPYYLTINTINGFWINRKDEFYLNPSDGKILKENLYKDKSLGSKVINANLNLHTGSILGLTGKFVAFFVSLISASLPISGFYIWWWRRKRKRKIYDTASHKYFRN